MIFKHSIIYFFSRGIPSLISFLSVLIYTHMLSPSQYGNYALTITIMNLANIIFFQWIRIGLLRFMPNQEDQELRVFQSTILAGFIVSSIASFLIIPFSYKLLDGDIWLVLLVLCNIWVLAWFELNQTLYRTLLKPIKYGVLSLIKVVFALLISVFFLYLGFGEKGLLLGILLGTALSLISSTWVHWKGLRVTSLNKKVVKQLLIYGLPLTVTFSMSFVIQFSDRFFLNWFEGASSVGLYAVAMDLSTQTIAVLMMTINLGALPIAIKKYEEEGYESACIQLEKNFLMMIAVTIPCVVIGIVMSQGISTVFFSGEFQQSVKTLLPLLLIATFCSGIKSYYFDQAFQIGKKTLIQIIPVAIGAFVSMGLNFILIPMEGVKGAAVSSIVAYSISLIVCWFMGNKVFKLPVPLKESMKIVFAGLVMFASIFVFKESAGLISLILVTALGGTVYIGICYFLNVLNIRKTLTNRIVYRFREKRIKQVQ